MLRRKITILLLFAALTGLGCLTANAQTASFNFTQFPVSISGWKNIAGNPAATVCSGTDATTGITVSSISPVNWSPFTNGLSAFDTGGISGGTFFPAGVMLNHWFQYNNPTSADYNGAIPQLKISGLNKDSVYTLRMTGSFGTFFDLDPTQYTVLGAKSYGFVYVNNNNNTATGAVFNSVMPDTTGAIYVYVNTVPTTQIGDICGIQIIRGSSGSFPTVSITNPLNNAGLAEDGNVTLSATASESGGSIAQVEFYVDTTLIGTVTSPPYNVTWSGADPGNYVIIANAVDANGNSNESAINVNVRSLNFYWSTTGNIGNNGDSNFIGNVDSVRLGLRTKNIERMTISPTGNVGIGITTPTAQLHVAGSVRLAGLLNDSTSSDGRMLVSDSSGNLKYRTIAGGGGGGSVTPGQGLAFTAGGVLALGDSISGSGAHNFTSNRYQYLNGFQYSIGGSVNDPVNAPNLRLYDNGDLTAGTTMDRSVNTLGQTGLRYYSKPGILQIGASDWLDTTENKIVYGTRQGSGLLINSDSANSIKGRLINTVFAGDANTLDSTTRIEDAFIATESSHFTSTMGTLTESYVGGSGHTVSAPLVSSILSGKGNTISKYSFDELITGYQNTSADSSCCGLISGSHNQFGGFDQLVSGQYLVNRTPFGATVGNANVDFSTLPYTGTHGSAVANIGSYPLLVVGNSSDNTGVVRSNALTVLFNGRTQINTTGFTNNLSQTSVTPKAALEVVSTNTGVLLPKLTTTQRNAIASGDLQNGLLLYNTDSSAFQFYNGSGWLAVGANVANGGWGAVGNAGTNPAVNFVGTTDSQRLVFRTHNVERMTILANGAVGIGTSVLPASDALLAVDGTIYTTKVKVTQAGWPDYVFDREYILPSLASVERYIRLHHHLPGIEPAGAVGMTRIDLGSDEAALLKKIEELTLYLLAEHRKAEAQQQEIERLKEENQRIDRQQREIDQLKQLLKQYSSVK